MNLVESVELKQTKIKLFKILLNKDPNEYTDNEADLLYSLSKDEDIQSQLRNRGNDG